MDKDTNFANEFPEGVEEETLNTDIPSEATKTDPQISYTLADGSAGSRAAFIREKFLDENLSRKEIAEKYDLPYRVVYSATVNMSNSAEATQHGRAASAAKIKVTESGDLVTIKDGETLLNGEPADAEIDVDKIKEVDRNTWIKEQVEEGVSRGDIAKMLGLSYGVIYGITKEMEGTRSRVMVTLEDGTEVSRSDYIRMQYASGVSRGDIAKHLDVPYSVVWQATKTSRTEADKFEETVEAIKAFADKVDNKDLFSQVCNALETIHIVEKEEKEETTETNEDTAG